MLRSVDLVVDQLIGGWFGYTAVEAMALGKPVISYIRDRRWASEDLPIINANPDSIHEVLKRLLATPAELQQISRRARAYVERHHSVEAFSERLRTLYLETGEFAGPLRRRLQRWPRRGWLEWLGGMFAARRATHGAGRRVCVD
jgi:hypothetical protein